MNETTNGTLGNAIGAAPVNPLYGTNPAHAASTTSATHVTDGPKAYTADEETPASYTAAAVAPTGDVSARSAVEPAKDSWQEPLGPTIAPAPEERGKHPGRGANLLLVATLAAVCGLAGGLAGGAIMSAVSGSGAGNTPMAQGGAGGGQQGGTATVPGGNGTNSSGDSSSSNGASGNGAPDGQAPSGTGQDAAQGGGAGNGTSAGNGASSDSDTDSSSGTDSSTSQSSTSQTALSA